MVYLFMGILFVLIFTLFGMLCLRYHRSKFKALNFRDFSVFILLGGGLALFNHFLFLELEKVEDPMDLAYRILYAVVFFLFGAFVFFFTKRMR